MRRADMPSGTNQTEEVVARTPIDERITAMRMTQTHVPLVPLVVTCRLRATCLLAVRWTIVTAATTGQGTQRNHLAVFALRSSTHKHRLPSCDHMPHHLMRSLVAEVTVDSRQEMAVGGTNTEVVSNNGADLVDAAEMLETMVLLVGRVMGDATEEMEGI